MNEFTLYYNSTSRENEKCVTFPQNKKVDGENDLSTIVLYDHTAVQFCNNYCKNENFLQSDCIIMDLDNERTDNPAEWKTLKDIETAFPEVLFYAVESRNHMKVKKGESARPRYHIYFPIAVTKDAETYKSWKEQIVNLFPFFDKHAMDNARKLYGVETPKVFRRGGQVTVDRYLVLFAPQTVIHSNEHSKEEKVEFGKKISVGNRNNELYRYAFRKYMLGLSKEEVSLLTHSYNNQLDEPLDEEEVNTLVNSACSKELDRKDNIRRAETAIEFMEAAETEAKADECEMTSLEDIPEREPEWLIEGYIPKKEITIIAGDGGVGKTFVWCAIAAAISSGKKPFLLNDCFSEETEQEPEKVMYFSSEDSNEAVLRPRLRNSGANLKNISTIDSAQENFQKLKFSSGYLEKLIETNRPALVIFDPLQSFLPPGTNMTARNQMREALTKLHIYGEKYGTTFLIIMHTNKQQTVWGRTRIADSADIWDISRSVLICGEADNKSHLKYLSQEKSSYGRLSQTVLFRIEDNTAVFAGYTDKRDRDYVLAASKNEKAAPAREAAEQFILEYLQEHGGEVPATEINEAAINNSFSEHTLRRAKSNLEEQKKIQMQQKGSGKNRKWYICPVHTASGQMNENI